MKRFILFLLVFIAGSIGGYILAQQREKSKVFTPHELIKKHIEETLKLEQEFFDSLFDEKFFSRDYDPFKEIEDFRKRMIKLFLNQRYADIFNNSFSQWFDNKIFSHDGISDGISLRTKEDDDTYTIEIENTLDSNTNLSIDIKQDHIKISYEKKSITEKDSHNTKLSSSSYVRSVKYFSLPHYIRGKDYDIEREKNKIIIKFSKK